MSTEGDVSSLKDDVLELVEERFPNKKISFQHSDSGISDRKTFYVDGVNTNIIVPDQDEQDRVSQLHGVEGEDALAEALANAVADSYERKK